MTKEQIIQELEKFNDFEFFEEEHFYEYKGKRVGMSVTRFIEEFANPFDRDGIAEKCAIRDNKSTAQILEEWDYKNKCACAKGTNVHEFAQSLWSGAKFNMNTFDGSDEFFNINNKIFKQAMKFYNDYKGLYSHIKDEQVIGSEEYNIASAIDHILYNEATQQAVLVDYKSNSILKGYNDDIRNRVYTKKMKVPLHKIDDDALHHYYLQLSIYKYLVEKYTQIRFGEMFIVYMSENIKNYEIIPVPYLEKEVINILESRREKNMNSVPVLVIGASGTGKSTSLRNFTKDEVAVINVLGKPLPFKSDIKAPKIDSYEVILDQIKKTSKKTIVIDDCGYLLTNEFMTKSSIKGFDKYNEMANNYFRLINGIKNIEGGKTVYLIMHEDTNENGDIKPKTIGKLLDDKVNIQGMFTICIRTMFENGNYIFRLKTNGQDCVKTPYGMFEEETMENDLKAFDTIVREYYDLDKDASEEANA